MGAKEYFKSVGMAIVEPIYKSLVKSYPNYAPGMPITFGKSFKWHLGGSTAYNNKIFYAAQNILVRKLTEAPIMFNKKKAGSKQKFDKFYSKAISNERRHVVKALSLVEMEDHDLNKLFDSPNEYQSGIEMMEDFWHNYGFGDGYLWFETLGETSRNQKPVRVHSLSRRHTEAISSGQQFNGIKGYRYTTINGTQIDIPAEQVLHMKHWNPNIGDLKGLGVDEVAAMDISLNNNNNVAQGAAFVNGGRGTLFSTDTEITADGDIIEKYDAKQMQDLREKMNIELAGASNNRRMYYANGLVNAQNYGDTLAEMELINAENSNWKSIFAICGVPVSLAPITEAATENNVKAGYKALVTNLVVSELRKFDQKLTQKAEYFYKDGTIAIHDLTEFTELAPDLQIMATVYNRSTGPALREDERRSIFGWDDIGGEIGEAILVPSGLMKIQDIISDEFAGMPDANSEDTPKSL